MTGKTILLVGAGFLGKHFLKQWLDNPENKAIVLDKIDSDAFFSHDLTRPFKDGDRITYLWGNSGDPEQLEPFLPQIDAVVYTAAIADVPYAAVNKRDTHRINVENTETFMKFLGTKEYKGRIILMSSESVYKKKECLPVEQFPPEKIAFKETDETGPHSEYGQSKLEQESVARNIARKMGLRLVVLRSATMYGMYARIKQVIPDYIRQLLETENIAIMGTGVTTSRDFINVEDTANAIISMLAADESIDGETINVGTGRETFLLNLANVIKMVCNQPVEPFDKKTGAPNPRYKEIKHKPFREGEQGARIVLDISKAKKMLKMKEKTTGKEVPWEPEIDLYYGLKSMIYWMATKVGYDEKELDDIYKTVYPERVKGRTVDNPQGNRV